MQNRFVGDIGDFGKYALLSALADNDLKLGVVWYLNSAIGPTTHGRRRVNAQLRECDTPLFEKLLRITEHPQRGVASVPNARVLPKETAYFEDPVEQEARRAWFKRAFAATRHSDIVFLDPDVGLRRDRSGRLSVQHVGFPDEVLPFIERRQTLVVYQHRNRSKGGFARFLELRLREFREIHSAQPWALHFRRGNVAFLIVPAVEHELELRRRAQEFLHSLWSPHWKWIASPAERPELEELSAHQVVIRGVHFLRAGDLLCVSVSDYHAEPTRLAQRQLQWLGLFVEPGIGAREVRVGDLRFRRLEGTLEVTTLDYHAGPVALGPQHIRQLGFSDRRTRPR